MPTNRQSLTTRMPNGLTNAAPWQTMGNAGLLDPTWAHTYANDFDTYEVADWSLTGVGTPTAALAALDGGVLEPQTSAGAADSAYLQLATASFSAPAAASGKQLFFKFSGSLSEVTNCAFYVGLAAAGAAAESATVNGIVIYKAAGATTLVLDIFVASAKTTFAFPSACVLAAATTFEVGFRIDPLRNVEAFFNPTTGANPINASVAASSVQPRGAVVMAAVPALPSVVMAPVIGLTNASAVARAVFADYLVVSKER